MHVGRFLPVTSGEVVKEKQHLKLGKLISWTRVHSIPKWHVCVGTWGRLQHVDVILRISHEKYMDKKVTLSLNQTQ